MRFLVRPKGFAKPRLRNTPSGRFCPAGRKARGTGCSNLFFYCSIKSMQNKKEQHPIRCCSWCDREDSNLLHLASKNCDAQANSMIQRRKLCGVHNFRRWSWWV